MVITVQHEKCDRSSEPAAKLTGGRYRVLFATTAMACVQGLGIGMGSRKAAHTRLAPSSHSLATWPSGRNYIRMYGKIVIVRQPGTVRVGDAKVVYMNC